MNNKYESFLTSAMLLNQSEVVSFIMKNEKGIDLNDTIFNKDDIVITTSTGTTIIPSSHYYDQMDGHGEHQLELLELKEQLKRENKDTTEIEEQIEVLYAFCDDFDAGITRERTLYEWRVVPYWLAEKLISKGETVLKYLGSNWWGIKDQAEIFNYRILKDIFEEMGFSVK